MVLWVNPRLSVVYCFCRKGSTYVIYASTTWYNWWMINIDFDLYGVLFLIVSKN